MPLNRLYYTLKPILPWQFRVELRKERARRRRASARGVWPIDPISGFQPPGWKGWPEKKRFAFVLTHDVEGLKGFRRVESLMALEQENGFRSSFNFVPKGEYSVSTELRAKLERSGFEVGVHGLEHDGKLYDSKRRFASKAKQIREVVKTWAASGFRSPLMQHKLAWLHALGVEYDASTFDTDPFEPQPDGSRTIFPFWVGAGDGSGYVELPYTLVQDFTLFTVLGEKDIEIWKAKVDWVAEHGGMVLLNTHPDYMAFGDEKQRDEFPIAYYKELLMYIRKKYRDEYWHAVPREVARYYKSVMSPGSRNSRRKICMVTYSHYDFDNRVRRYAEALARRGDLVDVIALSINDDQLREETIKGVRVHRIQKRVRDERSKWSYVSRLLKFLWLSALTLRKLHAKERYDLIHVHNMPDFLVFSALYPKLTGAKVILDIHDVTPELFQEKFGAKEGSLLMWALRKLERLSMSFADWVIVSNDLWWSMLVSRSVRADKSSVFLNSVDPDVFFPHTRTNRAGKLVLLFPGVFQWHQGLDLVIRALALLQNKLPAAELHLYGDGNQKENLIQLARELGVESKVKFFAGVPFDRVPEIMASADIGVVPKRADSFGNRAYSTKIMEFMSQGLPVVASRTEIDTFYFNDNVVRFFESGDCQSLADAILEVATNQEVRQSLVRNALQYVERNSWLSKRAEYFALVDTLSSEIFDEPGVSETSYVAS